MSLPARLRQLVLWPLRVLGRVSHDHDRLRLLLSPPLRLIPFESSFKPILAPALSARLQYFHSPVRPTPNSAPPALSPQIQASSRFRRTAPSLSISRPYRIQPTPRRHHRQAGRCCGRLIHDLLGSVNQHSKVSPHFSPTIRTRSDLEEKGQKL